MPIRVLIADDEKFFRIGIISELKKYKNIKIVGEARNGEELMTLLRKSPPDVLLLDLSMPRISGMDILEMIKSEKIPAKSIVISMADEEHVILKAIQAGAKGFFSKNYDNEPTDIYTAIESVMNDEFYFNEVVNTALLKASTQSRQLADNSANKKTEFSEIELNIIRYMSMEMTSQQIADKTHYTLRSLENKRQEMIHRAGVKTSVGLILFAIKHKLIQVLELQN